MQHPDPKDMQINLTGFLNGKNARIFMASLWQHLVSAQQNEYGVPEAFLEAKKAELKAKQVNNRIVLKPSHSFTHSFF